MDREISHDFKEETIEMKAKWFQSLPLTERMEMLCTFTDFALNVNPQLMVKKNVKQIAGRIQILSEP